MHYGIGAHRGHHLGQPGAIAEVALQETGPGGHRRAVPLRKVVERGDRVTVLQQTLGHHAADISGRTGDKNCHGWSRQWLQAPATGRARESVLFMSVAAHGNGAATAPPDIGGGRQGERPCVVVT